jgi:hypothetical protein
MILKKLATLALLAATTPSFAATVLVDFEKTWDYGVDVNAYYNGGSAADGSTGGSNLGVSFVNVSGLSNDVLGPYYSNAPSSEGVAYAHDNAYMNVATGAVGSLSLYYASPSAVVGAVKAYDGLNGTGNLLGSLDLAANTTGGYDVWNQATLSFSGTALSFDFTGSSIAAVDNISADVNAVPLPAAVWMFGAGCAAMFGAGKRRKQA